MYIRKRKYETEINKTMICLLKFKLAQFHLIKIINYPRYSKFILYSTYIYCLQYLNIVMYMLCISYVSSHIMWGWVPPSNVEIVHY